MGGSRSSMRRRFAVRWLQTSAVVMRAFVVRAVAMAMLWFAVTTVGFEDGPHAGNAVAGAVFGTVWSAQIGFGLARRSFRRRVMSDAGVK